MILYSYSDIVSTQNNAVVVAWEKWWFSSPNQVLIFQGKIDPSSRNLAPCEAIWRSHCEQLGGFTGSLLRDERWGFTTDYSLFKSALPPSAADGGPDPFAPLVWQTPAYQAMCASASCLAGLLQKSLQLSMSENKGNKGKAGYFLAKLRNCTSS